METIRFGTNRKMFMDRVRKNSHKPCPKKIHSCDEEFDILRKLEKKRTRDRVRGIIDTIKGKKEITIEFILKIVCEYFNMPPEIIHLKIRKREIVLVRQIAHYFSKKLTGESLATIGSKIGGKDHATVLFSCKTVNNLIDTDKMFRAQINELEIKLKYN